MGSVAGSVLGPQGGALASKVGGAIYGNAGKLGGSLLNRLLGGGGGGAEARGGGMYDGLQQPGRDRLDANLITAVDAQVFADAARANRLYVQQINDLLAFNQSVSGNKWIDVVNWYRSHPDQVGKDLADYNRQNPNNPILPHNTSAIENVGQYPGPAQGSGGNAFRGGINVDTTDEPKGKNPKKASDSSSTTTLALVGGGVLVVLVALIFILKKK